MQRGVMSAVAVLALAVSVMGTEEQILIRPGIAPTVDRRVEIAEWCDASGVRFCVASDLEVQVVFKHDAAFLYFAFVYGENASNVLAMPEIAIDSMLDRTTMWTADDWWFHVSATDCEAKGRYDVYLACILDHGDWSGVPNLAPSVPPSPLSQFEIRIPLAKLGVSVGGSIGIAFCILDSMERRSMWPVDASLAAPATWAQATLVGSAP